MPIYSRTIYYCYYYYYFIIIKYDYRRICSRIGTGSPVTSVIINIFRRISPACTYSVYRCTSQTNLPTYESVIIFFGRHLTHLETRARSRSLVFGFSVWFFRVFFLLLFIIISLYYVYLHYYKIAAAPLIIDKPKTRHFS